MYYDRSKKDWIGKPELHRFLSDWIDAIDRNYAIDEILVEQFEQSISERALQAKLFLDTRSRGRVSKKDFSKIFNPSNDLQLISITGLLRVLAMRQLRSSRGSKDKVLVHIEPRFNLHILFECYSNVAGFISSFRCSK